MKLIGLDVGSKRIGVAKADDQVRIAVPYGTILVDGDELQQIASFARVYGAEYFVIGLPRNSKGEETAQSQYVRQFATKLKRAIPKAKISFQDESLTSVEAEARLKKRKKQYTKDEIDAEAATIILQDFIEHWQQKISAKSKKKFKMFTNLTKKQRRWLILSSLAVFFGLILGSAIFTYSFLLTPLVDSSTCSDLGKKEPSAECERVELVSVKEGDSAKQIAEALTQQKLIRHPLIFQIYIRLNRMSQKLSFGEYELTPRMSVAEIAAKLTTGAGSAEVFRFTILPGETIAEIKTKLLEIGYSAEEVNTAFTKTYQHPVLDSKPATASLEGYLFGQTNEFYKDAPVEQIITTALDQLHHTVQKYDLIAAYQARNLSLHQGIILASMVQKEAKPSDHPTVAQVFLKRYQIGMKLDSDVTTKYALDQVDPERKIYTNNAAALRVEECHNTRLYVGLPCGPIANPGVSALLAVANPSDTDYLYFLTGDDQQMYYGHTEGEHNHNISAHCRVLCNAALWNSRKLLNKTSSVFCLIFSLQ